MGDKLRPVTVEVPIPQATKFKVRLVARGFQQAPGVDFRETFAATIVPLTWRIVLVLAAVKDWEIE